MNRTTKGRAAQPTAADQRPQLEQICGWLSADGVESSRVTEAEMAWLTYYLSITLAANLRRRLDLSPVQREDAIDAAHKAADQLRHVRKLLERQAEVASEAEQHRYEPAVVPPYSRRAPVDLGDAGVSPEVA